MVMLWVDNIKRSDILNLTFGEALILMKKGSKVARKGWNGKDMFAIYKEEGKYVYKGLVYGKRPHFLLKTAQNDIAVWNPSTSDILGEDWQIVD